MEKELHFTKMQGAGNDFIVIDNRSDQISLNRMIELAPRLCNRKFGIGADGILALEHPRTEQADYTMIYRNADGSDAGMCGNGARCMALFARSKGFDKNQILNVHDRLYRAEVLNGHRAAISFPGDANIKVLEDTNGTPLYQIYTGTEHVAKVVKEQTLEDDRELASEGARLRYLDRFKPEGTNVNFICGLDERKIRVRTYERGVENLTLACGTGAIASAIAWHHLGDASSGRHELTVQMEGGTLSVAFEFDPEKEIYRNLKLTGPADFVFSGTIIV